MITTNSVRVANIILAQKNNFINGKIPEELTRRTRIDKAAEQSEKIR